MVRSISFCRKVLLAFSLLFCNAVTAQRAAKIISYTAHPGKDNIALYWKDERGEILQSLQHLIDYTARQNKQLVFAMNGGMYMEDHSPLGLFVYRGQTIRGLNTRTGRGNFYLAPNGVFYITKDKKAAICTTRDFKMNSTVLYATQSGPMLVINGSIHPAFKQGSENLNIRNGVGLLPDGRVVFAMSAEGINFYDFALFFKNLGCRNALYLDGFVSRMYLPAQHQLQTDGAFGVMIGVIK